VTHLTNYIFDGARADLSKVISHNPAFQVTHSFATGAQGQGGVSPGTYNFGAVYASTQVRFRLYLSRVSGMGAHAMWVGDRHSCRVRWTMRVE
jgi:hypothetical protein